MSSSAKIGLGTFPFSSVFSKVDESTAEAIIKTFIEQGGYYIDTAPIYGFGYVESLIGKILKGVPRSRYSIISKCGWIWGDDKKAKLSGKRKDVIAECEKSLRRLSVDYIDLYISHAPDSETPYEETIDALFWLQMKGKIRKIGVSNVTLEQLMQYNQREIVSHVQNRFSLINRSFSLEFLSYCKMQNVHLIPYQIIERGLVTDSAPHLIIREHDLRNKKTEFSSEKRLLIVHWVEKHLKPISKNLGVSVEALAIWWAMNQPSVSFPILGATSLPQLIRNLDALSINLPKDSLEQIDESYHILEKNIYEQYSQSVSQFMGLKY